MNFRKAHVPDSRWSVRSGSLTCGGMPRREAIVLIADGPEIARLAAIDLLESGGKDVRSSTAASMRGREAGYESGRSADSPPDEECIDYLFFVHDRHAGNLDAMRQYLAWETGLIAQLDEHDRAIFKVGGAMITRAACGVMSNVFRAS